MPSGVSWLGSRHSLRRTLLLPAGITLGCVIGRTLADILFDHRIDWVTTLLGAPFVFALLLLASLLVRKHDIELERVLRRRAQRRAEGQEE